MNRQPGIAVAACLAALLVPPGTAAAADTVTDDLNAARRLTWERQTRQEGIEALRRLLSAQPSQADVGEALGEVLCWREDTRPEGIALLRQVLEQEPGRRSALLLLAEVLSWSRDTRAEAEALYRQVLADDPEATEARVGLARLLSWRGDLAASNRLYLEALQADPADPAARVGLAEVQRWSGRSRASLRTLRQVDSADPLPPAVRLARAEAWEDLDRPARALEEYEALLALEPDHDEARRRSEDLRRRLQPSLELGLTGSTESGDPATSKVRNLGAPLALGWGGKRDWRYHAGAGVGFYDNRQGSSRRTTAGGGLAGPLGLYARLAVDAAWNEFQTGEEDVTGRLALTVHAGERVELALGARREHLDDSRLTAGGEVIDGILYGPVREDAFYAGLALRPGKGWDLSARFSQGSITGTAVPDNDRDALFGGFGRTFHRGSIRFRPGYAFFYMAYDQDLSGFPPDDLGGDGRTAPAAGGYFSPARFINHMARLDVVWSLPDHTTLAAGGGIGQQKVDDTLTDGLGRATTSADLYVAARWRLSKNVDLRLRASFQNVAAAFDRTRFSAFLVRRF